MNRYSNDPDYHAEFEKARLIYGGDEAPDFQPAGSVGEENLRGTEVYTEAGLLTEAEVMRLVGALPSSLNLKDLSEYGLVRNEHGEPRKLFLVSLAGLDCGAIHSLRRIKMFSTIELRRSTHLLPARQQLTPSQPKDLMDANYGEMLSALPNGVKIQRRFELPTVAQLKEKAEQLEIGRELQEQLICNI